MASLPVEHVRHAAERRIRLLVISTFIGQQIRCGDRELLYCDTNGDLSPSPDMDFLPKNELSCTNHDLRHHIRSPWIKATGP
jgi:hypothetical protein